jgi:hypothetical protein
MATTPEAPKPDELIDTADDAGMAPPEEMTEEELRIMADTMPGEGPGDD